MKKDITAVYEQTLITKCILKGMTLKQIAQELKCAKSTASYKTRKLFEEYKANDRHEYMVNIFSKIILKYKNQNEILKQKIENFEQKK